MKSTMIGLIVERLADVDTIAEDSIAPPPSLGRKEHEHNKYVFGLARTGDRVTLLLDPEKLIKQDDIVAAMEEGRKEEQS